LKLRKEKRATKIESIPSPMAQKPLEYGLAVWRDRSGEQSTTKLTFQKKINGFNAFLLAFVPNL